MLFLHHPPTPPTIYKTPCTLNCSWHSEFSCHWNGLFFTSLLFFIFNFLVSCIYNFFSGSSIKWKLLQTAYVACWILNTKTSKVLLPFCGVLNQSFIRLVKRRFCVVTYLFSFLRAKQNVKLIRNWCGEVPSTTFSKEPCLVGKFLIVVVLGKDYLSVLPRQCGLS